MSTDSAASPEMPSSDLPELTLGAAPAAAPESNWQPTIRGKIDRFGVAMGTGRRKTSVARVRVKEGTGKFTVNGRDLAEYLRIERDRDSVMVPLKVVGKVGAVDVSVRVQGGGLTGQTGAIVLGVARALQGMNASWHHDLATNGLLTRDDRMVERKKYGFRKARRSFQFSKR
jgi:small subunit ribosomal protein S9